ncbi:MAG: lamin tail domain-containing protein, partial [Dehalococcoidia bacterium]|nr:lamin tail domain-containing protein [Dehalococcoidia bacterium]
VMTIALVGALMGGGVFAAFNDTEASANNNFIAGTLDLKTNNADGVTATFDATNMKPGDSAGPEVIELKNAGTVDGETLDISFSYVENDGVEPTDAKLQINKSADDFASELVVNTLTRETSDLLVLVNDVNGNGQKDLYDVAHSDLTGLDGIGAGETKDFKMKVTLNDVGNDFQADGITMTITFTLNQNAASPPLVRITDIFYDGVVPRVESDEYVEITNLGGQGQDVTGWVLKDISEGYPSFTFPSYILAPGVSIRVYTNEINPEWGGFSFGYGRAIWNNTDPDTAALYDAEGQEVSRRSY